LNVLKFFGTFKNNSFFAFKLFITYCYIFIILLLFIRSSPFFHKCLLFMLEKVTAKNFNSSIRNYYYFFLLLMYLLLMYFFKIILCNKCNKTCKSRWYQKFGKFHKKKLLILFFDFYCLFRNSLNVHNFFFYFLHF